MPRPDVHFEQAHKCETGLSRISGWPAIFHLATALETQITCFALEDEAGNDD